MMDDARGQPIILPAGPIFLRDRAVIAQALLERRIPSIAAFRENLEAGALISYGFDLMGLFYDIASYVHQIARGAKPSDMPIEQSPRFYMAVNLKTAASLGVSLSDWAYSASLGYFLLSRNGSDACDELINKGAINSSQANSGLNASGAGRVRPVIVGCSTRNRPWPSMILSDARSLPHGLAQLPEKLGRSGVAASRTW